MTNRRPSRCLGVIDEKKILGEMPEGRLWLIELLLQLKVAADADPSGALVGGLAKDRAAANIVSQLREEHAAALAAILLQNWFRRRLCPDGV